MQSGTFGFNPETHWGPGGFEGVAEVRRVEDLVRTILVVPDAAGAS